MSRVSYGWAVSYMVCVWEIERLTLGCPCPQPWDEGSQVLDTTSQTLSDLKWCFILDTEHDNVCPNFYPHSSRLSVNVLEFQSQIVIIMSKMLWSLFLYWTSHVLYKHRRGRRFFCPLFLHRNTILAINNKKGDWRTKLTNWPALVMSRSG